jgi:hypothetical protein
MKTLTNTTWKIIFLNALAEDFNVQAIQAALRNNFTKEDHALWFGLNDEGGECSENVEDAIAALEDLGLPTTLQLWEPGHVIYEAGNEVLQNIQFGNERDFLEVVQNNKTCYYVKDQAVGTGNDAYNIHLYTNDGDYFLFVISQSERNDHSFYYFSEEQEALNKFDTLVNELT